eukprot:9563927-Alexandrium_andersonii.AAC.1
MEGDPPGSVEKKRRFREKGDHCPESNLHVRDDSVPQVPSRVPSAFSKKRRCESCVDPAFSTMTCT